MSNHAHFIIRAELSMLSAYMLVVLTEYALYYNFKHKRNGHVFQNRFKSECIESETYFWSCLRYIHLNPVKAKITKRPEKYVYSSMNEFINKTPVCISQKAIVLMEQYFGETDSFKMFHVKAAENIFADIPDEVKQQQEELAMEMAENMKLEYELPMLCQVIEEKEIRKMFEKRLCSELKLSKRRSKELCLIVKNKIDEKK